MNLALRCEFPLPFWSSRVPCRIFYQALLVYSTSRLAQNPKVFHIPTTNHLKPGNPPVRPSATVNHFQELLSCVSDVSYGGDETGRGSNLGEKELSLAHILRAYCLSLCQGKLTHIWRDQEGQRRPEAGPGYKRQDQPPSDPHPPAKPHTQNVPQIPKPKPSSGEQMFK